MGIIKTQKNGKKSIQLRFKITQHSKDEKLLRSFVSYLRCGKYYLATEQSGKSIGDFTVVKFSELYEIIIPFLKKHPILGVKAKDFADFCDIAEIVKSKNHLTPEGLKKIKEIKSGMNMKRSLDLSLSDES